MKNLKAKSINQKKYIKSILDNQITICLGPAGTGKTHIAVCMGINALIRDQEIHRIIITRPVLEASDERLGYLPGDLRKKISPYMDPVMDEMQLCIKMSEIHHWETTKPPQLEIIPLAFMRGRNFHNAFIIGDEFQNATMSQIKLLLTRFGRDSKLVISGDITQSDLSRELQGGLEIASKKLKNIEDIGIIHLDKIDVVRNPLIVEILEKLNETRTHKNTGTKR